MIDADGGGGVVGEEAVEPQVIQIHQRVHVRQIRPRDRAEHVLSQRAHAARIDGVELAAEAEWLPGKCLRVGGIGVVQSLQTALGIAQVAEIAIAHFVGGDGEQAALVPAQARAFEAGEPESLVAAVVDFGNEHRAAAAESVFVAEIVRRFSCGVGARASFAKGVVAVRLEDRAVELVRAAAAGDDHRRNARVLGRGAVVLHLELLDRVEARRPGDGAAAIEGVGEGGAVEEEVVGAAPHAVCAGAVLHPGNQQQQVGDVASVDRQLLDAPALEDVAEGGGVHGDQRSRVLHCHERGFRGDFQFKVERRRLRGLDCKLGLELGQRRRFGGQRIVSRHDHRKYVESGAVGRRFERHVGCCVGEPDFGPGNDGVGRVTDGTSDAAIAGLRKSGRRQQRREQHAAHTFAERMHTNLQRRYT